MHLIQQNIDQLKQVDTIISQLKQEDYVQPLAIYNNSTLGQHFRHLIEFYLCLEKAIDTGVVNYDARERNLKIETDVKYAQQKIKQIEVFVNNNQPNQTLKMVVNYGLNESACTSLSTNIHRELAYCLDHLVHHLAIIKIGLKEIGFELNNEWGIAPSTLRNQNKCAR